MVGVGGGEMMSMLLHLKSCAAVNQQAAGGCESTRVFKVCHRHQWTAACGGKRGVRSNAVTQSQTHR